MSAVRFPFAGRAAAAVALVFAFGAPPMRAGVPSEHQVKAAFLYNFMKFVEWPPGMAGPGRGPIVIGVLGRDPFGPVLDETFGGKSLAGRKFEVRRYTTVEELQVCHMLFISSDEDDGRDRVLKALHGTAVMTVSDGRGFVKSGGIIELLLEDNKIRFDINLSEAKKSGLRISAQLLQLARKVDGR
jgi:hypothetical protein